MNTVEPRTKPAYAVWITGLPGSGKSTLAAAVAKQLEARGVNVAVLESDALRRVFTPRPVYDAAERDAFYQAMAYVGKLLVEHGVAVIFDATANLRDYRDRARRDISRFLEVYVDCPLAVCIQRDPKGIYRKGQTGGSGTVPGLQEPYEPPEKADVVVRGDADAPESAAQRVLAKLMERKYLGPAV
jgi:adenylylsulfate kinase